MTSTASQPFATPPLSRVAMYILLAIGPEERHGYAIMHEVGRITGGAVKLGPGAIYTTIKRLVGDGLIEESDERPDPELDDQRRRYYRLTALGRSVAAAEVRRLDALVASARPWALELRGLALVAAWRPTD
jgi:DNA-binding PadR family transcriptional regulator